MSLCLQVTQKHLYHVFFVPGRMEEKLKFKKNCESLYHNA